MCQPGWKCPSSSGGQLLGLKRWFLKNLSFHEMGAFSILLKGCSEAEHHVLLERQGDLLPAPTQHLSLLGKTGRVAEPFCDIFLWVLSMIISRTQADLIPYEIITRCHPKTV